MQNNISRPVIRRAPLLARLSLFVCVLVVVLASVQPLAAQAVATPTGAVTGRVLNQATGRYLSSAVVRIEGTNMETVTDDQGYYRFSGVPVGEVRITADYADLDRMTQTATVAAGRTTTASDIGLTAQVYQLEKFVVAGDREGSASALQEQRMSDTQKAIYTADSFGNVVDSNIGELMKNLPGITIDYDGEDASAMRIRGMPPELANITLDGNEMASISTGLGGVEEEETRAFSLDSQSLQNIESIEIKFAPSAADSASSMGGLINIRSKSALNQKGRRMSVSANLSLNTSELDFKKTPGGSRTPTRKIMPGMNFSFSDTFGKKRPLGVAFNVGFNRSYRFNNKYTLPAGYTYDVSQLIETGNRVTPETDGYVTRLQWSENGKSTETRVASLNLDWKFSKNTTFFLYTNYNDTRGLGSYSRYMQITAGNQSSEANLYNMISPAGSTVGMGYSVSAANTDKISVNLGARHTFGKLKIKYNAAFSRSESDPKKDENFKIGYSAQKLGMNVYGLAGNNNGTIVQTINDGLDIVQADDAESYLNIDNYSRLTLSQDFKYGTDEQRTANFDAEYPVVLNIGSHLMPINFKAGGRYSEQRRETHLYYRNYRLTGNSGSHSFGSAAEPDITQFMDPYFGNSWSFDVPISNWLNPYYVLDYYYANPNQFYSGMDDPTVYTNQPLYRELGGRKSAKESTKAGYVEMTTRLLPNLRLITGLRYEKIETTVHSNKRESSVDGNGYSKFSAGRKYDTVSPTITQGGVIVANPYYGYGLEDQIRLLFQPQVKNADYDKLYPNIQLTWDVTKNFIIRAARTQNAGKPNFSYILKDDYWNESYMRVERGNEDLKPQTSVKYDVAFEYYFKKNGSLTLSLFRQDFKDYIVKDGNVTFLNNVEDPSLVPESGFDEDGTEVVYEPGYDFGLWVVQSPTNEGTGKNQGFELAYRQRLGFLAASLRNFEVYAAFSNADPTTKYRRRTMARPSNATAAQMAEYMNSPKEWTTIPMKNVQKRSATLQLRYLGRNLNGSIKAYWVDKFARDINSSYVEINYQDAYIRYDLSLSYKIGSRWTASFDWRNITNEGDTRMIFDRTGGYFTSGMVINLGLKANF